jgi:hypothetical protein
MMPSMTVPLRTLVRRRTLAIGGFALLVTVAAGLGVVRASRGDDADRMAATYRIDDPYQQVLALVRVRAPGREPIVVVASDPALQASLAALATAYPQIALRGRVPALADPDHERALARGRVFLVEPAQTPALEKARADMTARGWGLTSGMAFDKARERFGVLQVSSPPAPDLLWVPADATGVEREFWIDGTFGVSFALPIGPGQDAAPQAVRAHLESQGWTPQRWEHLNPLTPTSLAAGWYIGTRGILPEGYDPARDGPLPAFGQWIGEWRDAAGNQIAYRFQGDGRHGRASATFWPAVVIAEMDARRAADRASESPHRPNVSRDGAPVSFDLGPPVFVLADPAALAARREALVSATGRWWGELSERLRSSAPPHRIAVGDVSPNQDIAVFRFGGDDVEPATGGEPPGQVVDVSSGVLIAAAMACVPKLADILTSERVRQVLEAPAGDTAAARRLQDDVGRGCFAIVRGTPGQRFSGNGAYRLRPGAPARVASVAGAPRPTSRQRRY